VDLHLESVFEKRPEHYAHHLLGRGFALGFRGYIVTVTIEPTWSPYGLKKAGTESSAENCVAIRYPNKRSE
jgi:hypothetical protein